jgi:DNA modification methylase
VQIEQVATADLIPYARNARTHSDSQVAQIAGSIQEFGFTNPVLIDSANGIIAGHGRVMAAQKLGLQSVPCIRLGYLTDAQKRAYILADNRIALNSGWDDAMLEVELAELHADEFDLGLLGFDADELSKLMSYDMPAETPVEVTEDEVPEPPADPITKPGDLWILGEHRLLCGDSTKAEDVRRLLEDRVPFIMVTDPPYGVEYDADWRNEALAGKPRADGRVGGGGRAVGKVTNDDQFDWTESYKLSPCHVAYVWHAGKYSANVCANLQSASFEMRCQIIWKKSHFAIGRGHYHWGHEPAWYACRSGGSSKWCGDRTQSTIWEIQKPQKSETGHSTQKPVECMARPIRNHGDVDDDVYDPFLGSGTTLIAAEQLNRKCYGMEISPQYCDVIVKRWETLTGKTATLEAR